MAVDWDREVLAPAMGVFGEGLEGDEASLPLYTAPGGQAFRLQDAVFDREYADVSIDDASGNEVTTRKPMLGVRLSRFADVGLQPEQGGRVDIPSVGEAFLVRDVRPDGHGHAKLMLMVTR